MGGGERIGEPAVPCNLKSALCGDPSTGEAVTRPKVGLNNPTMNL